MRDWFNTQNAELTLPNKSVICFGYAENPGDVAAQIGQEYMDIVVDQAEMLTEKELVTLKSCNRWPGMPESSCKFVTTFNPGNVGHKFLKRVFIDKQYHEKERPQDYEFLQAFGWDNIEWSRPALNELGITDKQYYGWSDNERYKFFVEKSQYGRELDALPQALRIGWLLGKMDQFAGQYFDIFDPVRHVARCQPDKEWYPKWLGIDWGFGHPSACHWFARPNRKTGIYRERLVSQMSPRVLAQQIVEDTPEHERGQIDAIYLSHDAFAQKTSPETIAIQMGQIFKAAGMPQPSMEDRDPVGGAALFYEMLRDDELLIDPSCKELIDVIPMITRDEDQPEKTVKFEGDDAFDSARIGLKMRPRAHKAPLEERVMERLESLPVDMSQKMLQRERIIREEKKSTPGPFKWRQPRTRWTTGRN